MSTSKQAYIEGKTFLRVDFSGEGLERAEYDNCRFEGCNFAKTNLAHIHFVDSSFKDCDLSTAILTETSFKDVLFNDCKMLGMHFEHCNPFLLSFRFENCLLDLSSFYLLRLLKTSFKNCSLKEVDFTQSDFSGSKFEKCDFLDATFDRTKLEKADLRGSVHYSIHPETNKIKKAKFSLQGIPGLLDRYDIAIEG